MRTGMEERYEPVGKRIVFIKGKTGSGTTCRRSIKKKKRDTNTHTHTHTHTHTQ